MGTKSLRQARVMLQGGNSENADPNREAQPKAAQKARKAFSDVSSNSREEAKAKKRGKSSKSSSSFPMFFDKIGGLATPNAKGDPNAVGYVAGRITATCSPRVSTPAAAAANSS